MFASNIVERIDETNDLLSFDVTSCPTEFSFDGKTYESGEQTIFAVDGDDIHPIKTMGAGYSILTPEKFRDLVTESLDGHDYKVIASGNLRNYSEQFMVIELLGESEILIGNDKIHRFIMFGNNHKGERPVYSVSLDYRPICENQTSHIIGMSKHSRGLSIKVRHTKHADIRLAGMNALIDGFISDSKLLQSQLSGLAGQSIQADKLFRFYLGFLNSGNKLTTRTVNRAMRFLELFKAGKGNKGETLYDAYNAVTEYHTHCNSTDPARNTLSSLQGNGAKVKQAILPALLSNSTIDALADAGDKLFTEYVSA